MKVLVLLALIISTACFATNPAYPINIWGTLDKSGFANASGTLTICDAGTTDLRDCYTDKDRASAAANPLTLDTLGRGQMYTAPGWIKILLKDDEGVTVFTDDNVSIGPLPTDTLEATVIEAASSAGVKIVDDAQTLGIFVEDGGQVGIGVAAPSSSLDVAGTIEATLGLVVDTTTLVVNGTTNKVGIGTAIPTYQLESTGSIANNYISLVNNELTNYTTNSDNGAIYVNYEGYAQGTTVFRDFHVCDGKHNTMLMVDGSAGKVGIGTAAPGEKLEVAGTIECIAVVETSDARLKKNIKDIAGSSSAKIKGAKARSWDWLDVGRGNKIGFIAQELEEVMPEAVVTHPALYDDEGLLVKEEQKGIVPSTILTHLVKAVQEQMSEIETLTKAMNVLIKKVEKLEK